MGNKGSRALTEAEQSENFGPSMRSLTQKQRRFVLAALETGQNNNSLHARMAGFEGDARSIAVTAHRLSHDPKIQAAIQEEARRRMNSGAIVAVSKLLALMDSNDEKVQLKAIEMVMNRIGMHAMTESRSVNLNLNAGSSDDEIIKRIEMLANSMGIDPAKLLGANGPKALPAPAEAAMEEITDADFVEVERDGTEGLEDLL